MDTRVENPEDGGEGTAERSQRKTQPAKGKRYSPAQRKEILAYAGDHRVKAVAEQLGGVCRPWTLTHPKHHIHCTPHGGLSNSRERAA